MNMKLIAGYLQFLRKNHGFTQEELAKRLDRSRQAVSKWETGAALPDLEVLLEISRLYGITVNDLLEPRVQPKRITDFEEISAIPPGELKEILEQFDANALVTALMGASPELNGLCEKMFPDIDFEKIRNKIGRIRIEAVQAAQDQIVSMINLQALDGIG